MARIFAAIALAFLAFLAVFAQTPAFSDDYARSSLQREQTTFSSYDEALRYVRKHYDGESTDTSRSSWIRGAEYYPAGGKGYLIINMRGKDYIFKGVPENIWQGFKSAPSPGGYYHAQIKGQYYFSLN